MAELEREIIKFEGDMSALEAAVARVSREVNATAERLARVFSGALGKAHRVEAPDYSQATAAAEKAGKEAAKRYWDSFAKVAVPKIPEPVSREAQSRAVAQAEGIARAYANQAAAVRNLFQAGAISNQEALTRIDELRRKVEGFVSASVAAGDTASRNFRELTGVLANLERTATGIQGGITRLGVGEQVARGLAGSFATLNQEFRAGLISQEQYRAGLEAQRQALTAALPALGRASSEYNKLAAELAQVRRALDQVDQGFKNQRANIDSLANLGVAFGGASIIGQLQGMVNEAGQAELAMRRLEKAVENAGDRAAGADAVIAKLSSTFKLAKEDLAGPLATLINLGVEANTAGELLLRLGASAKAVGRDFNAGFEAVANTLASGVSTSLQFVGVAANVGEAFGKVEKSMAGASQEAVNQAKALELLKRITPETEADLRDLGAMFEGYSGKLVEAQNATRQMRRELGEQLMPVTQQVLKFQTDLARVIGALPEPVRAFGLAATAAVAGVTALAGAINILKAAALPLLGPAGIFALIVGGIYALITALGQLAQANRDNVQNKSFAGLSLDVATARTAEELKKTIAELERRKGELNEKLRQLGTKPVLSDEDLRLFRAASVAVSDVDLALTKALSRLDEMGAKGGGGPQQVQRSFASVVEEARRLQAAVDAAIKASDAEAFVKASSKLEAFRTTVKDADLALQYLNQTQREAKKETSEWSKALEGEALEKYRKSLDGMSLAALQAELALQRSAKNAEKYKAVNAEIAERLEEARKKAEEWKQFQEQLAWDRYVAGLQGYSAETLKAALANATAAKDAQKYAAVLGELERRAQAATDALADVVAYGGRGSEVFRGAGSVSDFRAWLQRRSADEAAVATAALEALNRELATGAITQADYERSLEATLETLRATLETLDPASEAYRTVAEAITRLANTVFDANVRAANSLADYERKTDEAVQSLAGLNDEQLKAVAQTAYLERNVQLLAAAQEEYAKRLERVRRAEQDLADQRREELRVQGGGKLAEEFVRQIEVLISLVLQNPGALSLEQLEELRKNAGSLASSSRFIADSLDDLERIIQERANTALLDFANNLLKAEKAAQSFSDWQGTLGVGRFPVSGAGQAISEFYRGLGIRLRPAFEEVEGGLKDFSEGISAGAVELARGVETARQGFGLNLGLAAREFADPVQQAMANFDNAFGVRVKGVEQSLLDFESSLDVTAQAIEFKRPQFNFNPDLSGGSFANVPVAFELNLKPLEQSLQEGVTASFVEPISIASSSAGSSLLQLSGDFYQTAQSANNLAEALEEAKKKAQEEERFRAYIRGQIIALINQIEGTITSRLRELGQEAKAEVVALGAGVLTAATQFLTGDELGALFTLIGTLLEALGPALEHLVPLFEVWGEAIQAIAAVLAPFLPILGLLVQLINGPFIGSLRVVVGIVVNILTPPLKLLGLVLGFLVDVMKTAVNAFIDLVNFIMNIVTFGFWEDIPRLGEEASNTDFDPDTFKDGSDVPKSPPSSTVVIAEDSRFTEAVGRFDGAVSRFESAVDRLGRPTVRAESRPSASFADSLIRGT